MNNNFDLERFTKAQSINYADALREIRAGAKQSCWMWYVFPQLRGLGHSHYATFYGLENAAEARAYFEHPVLGARLLEITSALLEVENNDPAWVMGCPDDKKLMSSMTLFEAVAPECDLFAKVLDKFFGGRRDKRTLRMIEG